MKKLLLPMILSVAIPLMTQAQTMLAPDQNPNYTVSRDKYMKMADSIASWHGTTIQETYEAIDWLADRQKIRKDRIAFRRQLQLEQMRWSGYGYRYNRYGYYNSYDYYPSSYYSSYGQYNNYRHRRWWW